MFKPGQSGNPAGRRPGALNERTKEQRSRVRKLIEKIESHKNFDRMLDYLKPHELSSLYRDLMEYESPKLRRTEFSDSDGNAVVINVIAQLPVKADPELPATIPEYDVLPNSEELPPPQTEQITDGEEGF